MNEKVQFLQAAVELLKEKLKANDLGKSQLENRLSNIQSRMNVLMVGSYKVQKENFSNLDLQLSNSHLFANSLKKVDANATNNLRKLEQHFGSIIRDSELKFAEIQQKMIGMLTQKEKILRNISLQIENHGHSIAAIEEWIKSDHQQMNSLHLVEQNLKQKVDLMQKNSDIKMQILQEKIKYLEYFKQSTSTHMKNFNSVNEEFDQKLKALKKELRKQVTQVSEQLSEKSQKLHSLAIQKIERISIQSQSKRQTKANYGQDDGLIDIRKKLNSYASKLQSFDQKFLRNNKKIAEIQQKIEEIMKDIEKPQKGQSKNMIMSSEKTERLKSSYQEKNHFQDMNYSSKKYSQVKQADKSMKKELLPRKNLFHQQMVSETYEEQPIPDMRGGIRGLLQKSKDKDKEREGLLRTNDPFGRKQQTSARKGLPPVKQDNTSKKKKETQRNKQQSQAEEEAMVYQIDEQGYLMDEEGNYLLDQTGAMIRLSPEQIQEYMMQQQN